MFKKCSLIFGLFLLAAGSVYAAQTPVAENSVAAQRRTFKVQRKQISKLVKQYKKASDADKPAIKAQLEKAVSERVDMGLAYVKARIEAEKANLQNWEEKVKADETRLDQIKAERLNDWLSGDAKKKFKAARKQWKKQLKQAAKH
jgi:hypothetical protein